MSTIHPHQTTRGTRIMNRVAVSVNSLCRGQRHLRDAAITNEGWIVAIALVFKRRK